VLDSLDAAAVRRWCGRGLAALRAHQHEIDELNVYPVPDGDTGTNLVLTLTSAQEALDAEPDQPLPGPAARSPAPRPSAAHPPALRSPAPHGSDPALPAPAPLQEPASGSPVLRQAALESPMAEKSASGLPVPQQPAAVAGDVIAGDLHNSLGTTMRVMARGALLGARGNSGVIVSQILRGMADTFATAVAVRGGELARALRMASDAAYAAVAKPVEGTVLSVVAAAAEGARKIASDDLLAVARAAARSAAEALARTPEQLPVLARAGVVDAGGRGLVLLLEALVEALSTTGTPPPADARKASSDGAASASAGRSEAFTVGSGHPAAAADGGQSFGYEVQYLLDATPEAVDPLRDVLGGLGDSLVIVGTGDGEPPTWNVHVHVAVRDVGAAIEAGVVAGRPHRISVTHLKDTRHSHAPEQTPQPSPPVTPDPDARATVVVAAGDGLTAIFTAEGATVVDRNPSTAEMLAAIAATGAGRVVLLPNDANTHAVARSAAQEAAATGVRVSVVPTRSPVQALAALAVRDPGRPFDDDVIAMAEAAGACRYGEVCTASREALTVAGRCLPGDLLGLVDGEVHVIGPDLEQVCRELLDRLLGGGGELVTLVLGAGAPAGLEERLRGHVLHKWPFVELNSYAGGQPRYHLLVGVE
jgi:DAK2 domain fusion protein YloV